MNLRINHFRMLILPPFWGNIFLFGVREHWLDLVIFSFIFNGVFLLRGEFLLFVFSTILLFLLASVLFVFYVIYMFSVKAFKDADFREKLTTGSSLDIAKEVLGIEFQKPNAIHYKPLSVDLPDTTSKIGFAIVIGIKLVTIIGILYVSFLVANG